MSRLVGLRFIPADLVTHWEALKDLPDAVLERAVTLAGKTRVHYPTPYELRQDADSGRGAAEPVEEDRGVALDVPFNIHVPETQTTLSVSRTWTYYCDGCSDTGWLSMWCGEDQPPPRPWHESTACSLACTHPPHEWVRRCACHETNPALLRKRERQQRYAARQTAKYTSA